MHIKRVAESCRGDARRRVWSHLRPNTENSRNYVANRPISAGRSTRCWSRASDWFTRRRDAAPGNAAAAQNAGKRGGAAQAP